jgi:serine/threonine protein kinase
MIFWNDRERTGRRMYTGRPGMPAVSMGEILNKKYYKLCGTPYYMAPEMILNLENFDQMIASESSVGSVRVAKVYDNKIDIWGYGICLYELLFNVLPFSNLKEGLLKNVEISLNLW